MSELNGKQLKRVGFLQQMFLTVCFLIQSKLLGLLAVISSDFRIIHDDTRIFL